MVTNHRASTTPLQRSTVFHPRIGHGLCASRVAGLHPATSFRRHLYATSRAASTLHSSASTASRTDTTAAAPTGSGSAPATPLAAADDVASINTTFKGSTYQHSANQLMTLVNDLRDIGAHSELDLPTIVVCGNQSAGKSSLLEALSGIRFPRNVGTCTRCPSEVRHTPLDLMLCNSQIRCQTALLP
jgi:hypothetical protein